MHLNRLNLNLLVALRALLIEKNVTHAATRLNVSQPAMSGSLRRLREYFDDALLEPDGHNRLKLTPRARHLAGPVQNLLGLIEATLRGEPEFDPTSAERDIQIAMSSYCAHVFGSMLIEDLRKNAPGIVCHIQEISKSSIDAVANGDLDFCITLAERSYLEAGTLHRELVAAPAFLDCFVVVASSHNDMVREAMDLDTIRQLPLVEVRIFGNAMSVADRVIARYDKPCNTAAVVFGYHAAMAAVSGTSMVTVAPALLAKALSKSLDLAWYEPAFELPECRETLIWHARNGDDPVHSLIRQRVATVAERLGEAGRH
jgi:LysR family nod box-dependent transcriptional activator